MREWSDQLTRGGSGGMLPGMELRPVKKTSASKAVFEQLIAELVAGGLEPGESLPAERALTETLSVNRGAVREALQRLSQAGLVEISHGEPTRALDFRRTAGLDLLGRLLFDRAGRLDVEVARSITEMRALIGPDVARLAALRCRPEIIPALDSIVDAMENSAGDLERLARIDLEFWDLLTDAADNIAYRLAFNSLRQTYEPMADELTGVMAAELIDLDARRAIVNALRASDPTAAETAARALLARGSVAITEALAALDQGGDP